MVCIVESATHATVFTIATKSEDQYNCSTVYPDDFKLALKDLLDIFIRKWHVVFGLTDNDMASVIDAAEPGLAGWNSRLVYSTVLNTWKPYYELVIEGYIRGVLVRGNAYSMQISSDLLEELKKLSPLISLNNTIKAASSTVMAKSEKEFNRLAVTISLGVGSIVALTIYLVLSKRY